MPTLKLILLVLGLAAFIAGAIGNAVVADVPMLFAGLALWISVALLDRIEGLGGPR